MERLWLFSGSFENMQYLLELEQAVPSRFQFVNLDAIYAYRRRVDDEYLGDDEAEREFLQFSGMPVPVFRIANPDFAPDYFSAGVPCISSRLRNVLDMTDTVIQYREIDLDESPASLHRQDYRAMHVMQFADPIDWDRTAAQTLTLTRPNGSLRTMRLLPPPNPADPTPQIHWREDFVAPAPLFRVMGTAWALATDALAERVMRAGITDIMFQDVISERGQTEFVIKQIQDCVE
jgi:hypothetical protein